LLYQVGGWFYFGAQESPRQRVLFDSCQLSPRAARDSQESSPEKHSESMDKIAENSKLLGCCGLVAMLSFSRALDNLTVLLIIERFDEREKYDQAALSSVSN